MKELTNEEKEYWLKKKRNAQDMGILIGNIVAWFTFLLVLLSIVALIKFLVTYIFL